MKNSRTIEMQYPHSNGFDGQIHEITPYELLQVNRNGNTFYVLFYRDETLNRDMQTVLERTNTGFKKRPLRKEDYIKLGWQLRGAKPVDLAVLGSFIGLGASTTLRDIVNGEAFKEPVRVAARVVNFEVFIRNDGLYVNAEVASLMGKPSRNGGDVRVTQEEINTFIRRMEHSGVTYEPVHINQRMAQKERFEVFIRNNGLFVNAGTASLMGFTSVNGEDVRVTERDINEFVERTRHQDVSYEPIYINQRMARKVEFEVFIRNDGMYVRSSVASLMGISSGNGRYARVTQAQIDEFVERTRYQEISYEPVYIDQREYTRISDDEKEDSNGKPNKRRELQMASQAIFDVYIRNDGMYVNSDVASLMGISHYGYEARVTQRQIDEFVERTRYEIISYVPRYIDQRVKEETHLNTDHSLPSKRQVNVFEYENGLFVHRKDTLLFNLDVNPRLEYYYITKEELEEYRRINNLEIVNAGSIIKDQIHKEKGSKKLLFALETTDGVQLDETGFYGLTDNAYSPTKRRNSNQINRILAEQNAVPYTLCDKEELIETLATAIKAIVDQYEDKTKVGNAIFNIMTTVKDGYHRINTSSRKDVLAYYQVLIVALRKTIEKNAVKVVDSKPVVKKTPGQGNGKK